MPRAVAVAVQLLEGQPQEQVAQVGLIILIPAVLLAQQIKAVAAVVVMPIL
jgi:hypothetical protein